MLYGTSHAKMCLMPYANNKGADQPAHLRSLISTFVFRCLDSMICILTLSKVSRFLCAVLTPDNEFSGITYSLFRGRQNILITILVLNLS